MTFITQPSPLEGKRPIAEELLLIKREINRVERKLDEHTALADAAYPNADRRRHYDHHVSIDQKEIDRREFWRKVIPQVVGGFILASLFFTLGAIAFFLKFGGA